MKTITRILVLLPLLIAKLWTAELHWENQHSKLTLTPKQTTGTISFKARNLSQELVEIDRVESSCGCTISDITNRRIEPGQTTEVVAKFDKKGRRQNSQVQLQVYLKGQIEACTTLSLAVEIHTAISLKPAIVYWRTGDLVATRTLEVIVDPRYAGGIDTIEYDAQQFEVKTQPSDSSTSRYQIHIKPLATASRFQASIAVHSRAKNGYASERAVFHAFVRP
jgi:hypothetical protein